MQESRNQFRFSVQRLFDVTTVCCVVLGVTVAEHEEAQFAILAAGMLLFQITGREWRRKTVLALCTVGLMGLVCLALWIRDFPTDDGFFSAAGGMLTFGTLMGILATSLHNCDLRQFKGPIGLVAFVVLLCWHLVPSVH